MTQPSFEKHSDSSLDEYFSKAKKSSVAIDRSIARTTLRKPQDQTLQEGPFYNTSLNGFGLYSRTSLVTASLGVALVLSTLFSGLDQDTYSVAPSISRPEIIPASYTKNDLYQSLAASTTDPEAKVTVAMKHDRDTWGEYKMIPPLRVTEDILGKLGFRVSGKDVIYEANVVNRGYLKLTINNRNHSVRLADQHKTRLKSKTQFYPLYVSKMDGKQVIRFRFDTEDSLKMYSAYFNEIIDDLVPITLPDPQGKGDLAIFWFSSQPSLFELLVSGQQADYSTENSEAPDLSESDSDLKVYNNPFVDRLEIGYSLKKSSMTRVDLVAVGTGRNRELIPAKQQEPGFYNQEFDLSSLPKGIYTLVLTSNKKRIAKRIIKQ